MKTIIIPNGRCFSSKLTAHTIRRLHICDIEDGSAMN